MDNTQNITTPVDPHLKAAIGNLSVYIGKVSELLDKTFEEKSELLTQNESLFSDIDSLESKVAELESRIDNNSQVDEKREKAEQLLAEAQSKINELNCELEGKSNDLDAEQQRVAELKGEVSKMAELQKDLEFAKKEIARRNISGSKRDEQSQILKDKLAESEAQRYKISDELSKMKSDHEKLIGEHSSLISVNDNKDSRLQELQQRTTADKATIENYKELIESLESDIKLLSADLQQAKSDIYQKAQKVKDLEHDNNEYKEQIKSTKATIEQSQGIITRLNSDLKIYRDREEELFAELEIRDQELEKFKIAAEERLASYDKVNEEYKEIERDFSQMGDMIRNLRAEIDSSDQINKELDKKNLELIQENTELSKDLQSLKKIEGTNDKLISELESARQSNFNLREKIEELTMELEEQKVKNVNENQISLDEAKVDKLEELLKSRYQQISYLESEINDNQLKNKNIKDATQSILQRVNSALDKVENLEKNLNRAS